MKIYSQLNKKWSDEYIGKSKSTIKNFGCLLVCLSMLREKNPSKTNKKLTEGGGYFNDLIISEKASKILKLKYYGKSYKKPSYKTIMEVVMKSGQQHFVLFCGDYIIDPLGGIKRPVNFYKFKSFRLFKR
jgi:hypothetical protein